MNIKKMTTRRRFGESLVEVIMAVFVVALGSGVATSLIISALQSNSFSRDNLVALNLAVEGLEAVRTIRDNNWLKFNSDKEKCWGMRPETVDCETAPQPIVPDSNYTVDLDTTVNNYHWNLSIPYSDKLDLSAADQTPNAKYQLAYLTNPDGSKIFVSGSSGVTTPSIFYRMISIQSGSKANEGIITSLVQWRSQGAVHQVSLQTIVTNYQKVKVKT